MGGIGRSVTRLEDPPLLRGQGRFAADIRFPGELHMRVVRSPIAHGRILEIDTADALDSPGVVAVWTGADVAEIPPIDFRQMRIPGLGDYRQPILAQGMVRYVGEPVAIVIADSPYAAEDAAELVFADIEELDPVMTAVQSPGEFAPGLTTEAGVVRKSYGDLPAAFAAAAHVFELELGVGRHTGVPMETRGAIGYWNADLNRLEMHGASKVPHANRLAIAKMLSLPPEQFHLFEGHVGGGFGIRGEVYPEDVLACLAALRLKRPVKWIEDRKEHLLAANHSRDQLHRLRAAVDANGVVLGIEDEFFVDQGGYVRTHASTVTDLTAGMLPGPYRVPAFAATGHIRLTNKTPAGTYRAPGRYEGTFVRERLMDHVADRLGLDRVEIRRRNLIPAEQIPFRRGLDALGTEVVYDSADFAGLLAKLEAGVDLPALEATLAARRAAGEKVGLGLAYFVEKSGLGPFDDVIITIAATGAVEIVTGAASVGQGVETVMAQVAASVLGVAHTDCTVVHGQTDRIARGMGAFASRVTVMTGAAVTMAAEKLKERLLAKAAQLLQGDRASITLDGCGIPLGELAAACAADDGTPALTAEASFTTDHMTYPYGVHLAVVRVDAETFGMVVERFVVAFDVGRSVNPMLVEGQIHGGAAQGIGGALFEEFIYSEDGQPLSASFADYLMPTLNEVPMVESLVLEDAPSPINPLGVKGAGEGGITAAGAAIASAIENAIQYRINIAQLPVTPARLRSMLQQASGS
ncbi:xanthine dehydrogenase family protein molybdopterin-binding subunit [Rhodovarius crocodyli]|uniref:Xanthine dehydrogenase family protein molybdopterin-binding subunit n=1 Tax=Rhodovarius crocodyli TaxID=1979269 RepID=A0A437M3M7_9PROT|nr:xanthine dehydrogenase family protein molybdopterin-binding subunit [Rhodovarius crocodyli]RVT92307.1 xanthine dehydrogenase family protein molybdopterin-binding subunit [Rhodovarius crocodyli]